jgi:hypothetical protein
MAFRVEIINEMTENSKQCEVVACASQEFLRWFLAMWMQVGWFFVIILAIWCSILNSVMW